MTKENLTKRRTPINALRAFIGELKRYVDFKTLKGNQYVKH